MDFKFLRHPLPFEYENLESYLYRLANENAVPIGWILSKFNIKSRRFSLSISDSTIQALSKATLLSERTIRDMTASGLSSSNYDGINLKKGSKFCPVCLKEHCYPRVHWQFSLLNICNIHKSLLISHCPNCNATINNHMVINGRCGCGSDLRTVAPIYISNQEILDFNETLYVAHNTGIGDQKFFQDLTRPRYLEFIHALFSFVTRSKTYLHQNWITVDQKYEKNSELFTIEILLKIMSDWPDKLFSIFDDVHYYQKIELAAFSYVEPNFFNPVSEIYRGFDEIVGKKGYYFFNRILFTYFKSRYNYEYFKKKYKKYLFNQDYISSYNAMNLFAVDLSIFKKHFFPNYQGAYLNIHDVFSFYDEIINRIEISLEAEDYINFQELNHVFIPPVIDYFKFML